MTRFPLLLVCCLLALAGCNSQSQTTVSSSTDPADRATVTPDMPDYRYDPPAQAGIVEVIDESDDYWREKLTPAQFDVLRQDGTERAFTSDLLNNKEAGIYSCAACGLPLFSSSTKFKSGTGWPSFYQPIDPAYIREDVDNRYGMRRVEVSCARCNGHQGHVFPDGPEPTGLRYCINGVALNFVPQAETE